MSEAPAVRVRSRGQISGILEGYADKYRERYPDRDVRYVYDPTHKPELSGVLGRQAMGYRLVSYGELGIDLEGVREESTVRVGDLVLMSIPKREKAALRAEREALAKEQRQAVQRAYYDAIEAAANSPEAQAPGHTRPASRPMGRAVIEEKEFVYDIDPAKRREE